jgi:hypothetical protein
VPVDCAKTGREKSRRKPNTEKIRCMTKSSNQPDQIV